MTDDIVKHLTTINVLGNHVIVVLMNDHLTHTADIWMMEEHRQSSFTKGTNLFRSILGSLASDSVCGSSIGRRGCRIDPRKDLDCEL